MKQSLRLWFICAAFLFFAPKGALCFGAGEVHPEIVGRAFLHGDLAKAISHIEYLGDLAFKLAQDDIDAIYFGNWLRDYSQAMDTMGLTQVGKDAILVIVQALSFMAFGFATREFKLTEEKLGVYSHAEHIDNPKGYKWAEAKNVHHLLRGEVFEDELDIDPATGMKNYIAHEGQGYNTSARYVRNTLRECIARGRKADNMKMDNNDKYAALRLLGAALHTLEDFLAHSNWCELVLRKLGHDDVFCYVGDETWINVPNTSSKVPPLVTGTFSGNDFTISVFGTVEDKLCAHGSNDLQSKIKASKSALNPMFALKMILETAKMFSPKLKEMGKSLEKVAEEAEKTKGQFTGNKSTGESGGPDSGDAKTRRLPEAVCKEFKNMEAGDKGRSFPPLEDDHKPNNAMGVIWDVLNVRDEMMRELDKVVKEYPAGKKTYKFIQDSVNKVVWSIIAQVVSPAIDALTDISNDSHKKLYDEADQLEVFKNPASSNPTHSWLAKDHFTNALHIPAAKAAEVVVKYTVEKVVKAWNDSSYDAEAAIDEILETFHHPYFVKPGSNLQKAMEDSMKVSVSVLERDNLIETLTKENVKQKKNVRIVPQPKTTLDKLGDIFEEVTNDGPALVQKLGEELSKARETVTRISEKITNGEGQEVLGKLANETQQKLDKLDKIATDAKREVVGKVEEAKLEVKHRVHEFAEEGVRKKEEFKQEFKQEIRNMASRVRKLFG